MKRCLFAAVLLGAFLLGSHPASAQSFRFLCNGINADGSVENDGCGACNSTTAARWVPAILNFRVDTATAPTGVSTSTWSSTVTTAMGAWNNVSGQTLVISNIGTPVGGRDFGADDPNHELFAINSTTEFQQKVGSGVNGALGITLPRYQFCSNGSDPAELFDADLVINGAGFCWDPNNGNCGHLQSTLVHEMGHAFGLGHPCTICDNSVMSAQAGFNPDFPLFMDQEAIRALYPGNPGGIGYGCTGNQQCDSNLCITTTATSGTIRYCSQTCGTCPNGFGCENVPNFGMVCTFSRGSAATPVDEGGDCSQRPCATGLLCAGADNVFTCYRQCTPPNGACGANQQCEDIGNGQGVCVTTSGNAGLGQICSGSNLCQNGLICIVETSGATTGICHTDCSTNASLCGPSEACADLSGGSKACFPAASEGQACDAAVCRAGLLCIQDASTPHCFIDCTTVNCPQGSTCNHYQGPLNICEETAVNTASSSSAAASSTTNNNNTNNNNAASSSNGNNNGNGSSSGGSSGTVGFGGACGSSAECADNMTCIIVGTSQICVNSCDPREGNYECADNAGCRPNNPDDLSQGGQCIPGEQGSKAVGAACNNGTECKLGLCVKGKCSLWCYEDHTCGDYESQGYTCDDSEVSPGVCVPSANGSSNGPFKCNCMTALPEAPTAWLLGVVALALVSRRRSR